jgi:hypothetical protein
MERCGIGRIESRNGCPGKQHHISEVRRSVIALGTDRPFDRGDQGFSPPRLRKLFPVQPLSDLDVDLPTAKSFHYNVWKLRLGLFPGLDCGSESGVRTKECLEGEPLPFRLLRVTPNHPAILGEKVPPWSTVNDGRLAV